MKKALTVESCADAVEALLARQSIALTMGGEPTFVPLQPTGAEWAGAALGPTKVGFARRFAAELVTRFIPGAVVLETPGKLYPGEDSPRWSLQLHWRPDGPALWRDGSLLRADDVANESPVHDLALARTFVDTLAGTLGVGGHALPVEGCEGGSLALELGYVLPLDERDGAWVSDPWTIFGGCVTIDEDGRWLGMRLPLGMLPVDAVHRALTVEVRDGQLAVFIPPLPFEAYRRLLTAIEDAAINLGTGPLVLAGYAPPNDGGFRVLNIAPDPGVLEINVPPCATWREYALWLDRLYEAARAAGLCARKLHFNGTITGTGGGAHICFGGPTALESPFFARTDLLPSILRYWHAHPALSYVFTGLYLGPTSQAPRPDETLPGRLAELELACEGAAAFGIADGVFRFDQLFRHLLADGGGNTHRTEISVDKLWNAAMPNGCLGIVEWRAFESLPDATALSRVGLLLRAIVAMLAMKPCRTPIVPWGDVLHDRFFLPSLLWADLENIVRDLRVLKIPFDLEWLRPAWDFRFPKLGAISTPHGEIVFRQALEAWPLLSEQDNGAITSRTVDSSMDRIEACCLHGGLAARGRLLVNGTPIPFARAGKAGVAGIRFRAFDLPVALHPHVKKHAPLRLEWIDAKSRRVIAGATWHCWHPAGEAYPGLPADETGATVRRAERWQPDPSATGQHRKYRAIPRANSRRPITVDLRRAVSADSLK